MSSTKLDIERLIPQREPFVMVDGFEERDGNSAATVLSVSGENYFLLPDGTMSETGVIEHLAQSCAALSGSHTLSESSCSEHVAEVVPRIGLIGEVKHFECRRRPRKGEVLNSTVVFGLTFGNVTLATGQTFVGDELIADIKLKIFMQ